MLHKILTKKVIFMGPGNSDFCHGKCHGKCHGNVMEKSWNFVLEKLYEP